MKKLAFITLVFIGSLTQAQDHTHKKQKELENYTPEEIAQLKTKQLTLDLDLSDTQQKQISQLLLENAKAYKENQAKNSKSKKSLSKQEKLQLKNDRLDKQIEVKKKMKEILDNDQYLKWEKMSEKKRKHRQKRMHHKKKANMSEKQKQ